MPSSDWLIGNKTGFIISPAGQAPGVVEIEVFQLVPLKKIETKLLFAHLGMFWLTWSELISALFMVTVTGVLVGFCNTEIQYEYE